MKYLVGIADDRFSCARLVHDEYVRAGLMKPGPTGMRLNPQYLAESTRVIAAETLDCEIVGTIALIQDELPIAAAFDLSAFEGKLLEVSSLAVARKHRGKTLLFSLFAYMVNYSIDYLKADYLVITVHPEHISLYEDVFRFQRFGAVASYKHVEDKPAIAAYLNMRTVKQVWAEFYAGKPDHANIYKLFFERFRWDNR